MDVPYKLYKGDCLEIMPTLEAGSVDAIITDLPYGTTACAWDEVIPFAEMWKEVKRVLKPSGAFITTASQPFTSALVMSNAKWFREEIIWNKFVGLGHNADIKHIKIHENIIVFCKITPTYNPQMGMKDKDKIRPFPKSRETALIDYSGFSRDIEHLASHKKYPVSVFEYSGRADEINTLNRVHTTQKPVALYVHLVNTYTNFGETVLDFCMGSGTTIEAAIKTGRKSIGIERDPKYYSIAEKRISQAAQQPALFHATQQSVQRTGGESGQQSLFTAEQNLPAKVTRQSTRR